MLTILCTYNRTIARDDKTGRTNFSVITKSIDVPVNEHGALLCCGYIPLFPINMPLELTGKLEQRGKYQIFVVSSFKSKSESEAATISFLSSGEFHDIGEKTANEIVKIAGSDIFAFIEKEDAKEKLLKIPRVTEDIALTLIRKIQNVKHLEDVITYISSVGGSYSNAINIYDLYKEKTLETISNNPYMLKFAGLSFYTCEAIAKNNGIEDCDPRRISAIVYDAMCKNRQCGNTRISFHDLCSKIHGIENYANMGYYTEPLFIGGELLNKRYFLANEDNDLYVYLKKDYDYEKMIASEVKRLITSSIPISNDKYSIEEIERLCNIRYGKKQRESFNALNKSGIKIITGGPGTGKTSTINGLLRKYELENPNASIVLCAPTGCAAKQMAESTNREAFTFHRLLDIRPYGDTVICKDSYNPLEADCIVGDEISMADTQLMALLLRAAKNGALIILLGDVEQLPSVEAGNVLHDFIDSGLVEVYHLDEIFRQKGDDNIIIENSIRIKNGNPNLLTNNDRFEIRYFNTEEELKNAALQEMKKLFDIAHPEQTKLYTPTRKKRFSSSCINLNKEFKNLIMPTCENGLYYNGYVYNVGDLVIFTENNYDDNYFNGDEGIIIDIQNHGLSKYITVKTDSNIITLTGKKLDDIELGYAITAHKSQGGECDTALIIVPKEPSSLLDRSLIYVEATRAKQKNILFVEKDALQIAINTKKQHNRNTGLCTKLKEIKHL